MSALYYCSTLGVYGLFYYPSCKLYINNSTSYQVTSKLYNSRMIMQSLWKTLLCFCSGGRGPQGVTLFVPYCPFDGAKIMEDSVLLLRPTFHPALLLLSPLSLKQGMFCTIQSYTSTSTSQSLTLSLTNSVINAQRSLTQRILTHSLTYSTNSTYLIHSNNSLTHRSTHQPVGY